jgi:hypothetical protein
MTEHTWELGIDLNAVENTVNGRSYMPAGFIPPGGLIKRPNVDSHDTITFLIFDVTTGNPQVVTGIESFTIHPRAAVLGQETHIDPLSRLDPVVTSLGSQSSAYFGGSFPCWTSEVSVTEAAASKKFLLTFLVHALGPSSGPRTFVHDPEMVVGPNM